MGAISIIINLITICLVLVMIFKNIPTVKQEELSKNESSIKALNVFTSLLSDDNAAASNRAEQPVSKEGDIGDFTNFDTVDYEIEKHVVTYDINAI